MKLSHLGIAALLLTPLLAFTGCSKSSNGTSPRYGTMQVRLTDAPGEFEQVNLVVREVAVHLVGTDSTNGWQVLRADTATYDLLTLRNGVFTTIGEALIPAGHYTQIRLKLGTGSNVVVGGVRYPLTVPSGLQTGLKIVGDFVVPANGLMDVALEFDAERSIHQTGAGAYMLRPVVKALPFSTAGAIGGTLLPAGTAAKLYAIVATDTLGFTMPAANGSFLLGVLPAGVYSLAIDAPVGFRDTTLAGIAVLPGATTHVGDVMLSAQ